jgi:DNA-binding NarL/FixJ family response regulator
MGSAEHPARPYGLNPASVPGTPGGESKAILRRSNIPAPCGQNELRPAVAEWQRENEDDPAHPIRIVVVDDHRFMREMISRMLSRQPERYDVVAEAADGTTAVKACQQHTPDLLILDINLPDISGIEAVPQIRRVSPDTRILLCTALVSDERVIDALRSGAHGFVEKTKSWDDFVDAVERVRRGEQYFSSTSSGSFEPGGNAKGSQDQASLRVPLSQREREVLTLIAHGSTSKEIAVKLGVSFGTVDTHRTNLMRKLKIRNIAGLVVYAFRAGLIEVSR